MDNQFVNLYDFYKDLLTQKQRLYFEAYYFENNTLQEISEFYGISKNAIYDSNQKTIFILEEFEAKLKLHNKNEKLQNLISDFENNNVSKEDFLMILKEVEEI